MASNMTDDDKALVERLFAMADEYDSGHHESWPTIDALEIAAHRIEALSAENERLREALRYYANNKNYRFINGLDCTSVDIDAGDTARAALGETE